MTLDTSSPDLLGAPPSDPLAGLRALAGDLAANSRARSTRRSYDAAWRRFEAWAKAHGVVPLQAAPDTVALYLASLVVEARRASTIARALVAIGQVHRNLGHSAPGEDARVRRVLEGIRRRLGVASSPKEALSPESISRMLATCGDDPRGARDRALLALGMASGLRRSELVGLDVDDIAFVPEGVIVSLRHSKTDQQGAGRRVGVRFGAEESTCPVRLLRRWSDVGALEQGPLFRGVTKGGTVTAVRASERSVARIVKAAAKRAGLDPTKVAGHSLRSGCATALAAAGEDERTIARRLGHRTRAMSARYIRDANVF